MGKNEDRLDTVIGKNARIKGDINTEGGLRLDGQVEGNIDVQSVLITGKESFVKGEIRCKEAILAGRIEGNIFASGAIEMQTGAALFGDIHCKHLLIQKDCFFEGKCQMAGQEGESTI